MSDHREWMHAMNEALDEGIEGLQRDISASASEPATFVWELGTTMIELARHDPQQVALTCAAALYRLATAECRRDQEPCHGAR